MNKKTLSALIVVGVVVIAGLIWGFGFDNLDGMTYEKCVNNWLNEQRYLPSASSENIGAERTDKNENIWVKQDEDSWTSSVSPSTTWGDMLIDQQPGGKNYNPEADLYNLPECLKYSTRNLELEDSLSELINKNLESGFEIKSIKAEKKEETTSVDVWIACSGEDYLEDYGELIIKSLSENVFKNYDGLFVEDENNLITISFECGGDWIIKAGDYSPLLLY